MDKKPHHLNKDWRADAKEILSDLRKFQDHITAKYGYEGFSLALVSIDGVIPDMVVSIEYRAEPGYCVITRLVDGQPVDTFNSEIPM